MNEHRAPKLSPAFPATTGQQVRYRLSLSNPGQHLAAVEAEFPVHAPSITLALPVWTPGSYCVREYARHVQGLRVVSLEGRELPLVRLDKRSLRVEVPPGTAAIRLQYEVYANELTVRTSHFDQSHGFFNGAATFYYAEELRSLPCHLQVAAPTGWRVFTALPESSEGFIAANYDELVDAPIEAVPQAPIAFTVEGVPHEVVFWGEPTVDKQKLVADLTQVIATEAKLFGGLPQRRYLFIIHATDRVRGGLEHADSTVLAVPRQGLTTTKGWEDFLSLVAHEYFHLWNVKRVKPRAFVPFDYAKENYTRLLWYFEGTTSYYDQLLLCRAKLLPAPRYLQRLGETLSVVESTPGRRVQTLEDASFLAWIKYYRPDENSLNSSLSYYVRGEVVSLLLDLTLREASQGKHSLDDLVRKLWHDYGDGSGVPEEAIEAAASALAGKDLSAFFDRALRSTEDLDYAPLATVGLELHRRPRDSTSDRGGTPPRPKSDKPSSWLGLVAKGQTGIAAVVAGSPAMAAGLSAEDELIALDGLRCEAAALIARAEELPAGHTVRITYARHERLAEATVTLAPKPSELVWLSKVDKPTASQREAYAAWLGVPWEVEG